MWRWYDNLADIDTTFWLQKVLSQPRPSPFLTPAFLLPWARYFAGPMRLGCWRGDALVLLHQTAHGYELLGGQDVADRLDVLGTDPELWDSLRRECPACSFPNLAEDAWVLQSQRTSDVLEITDQSPYVPLDGSFDTYLARLGKKDRHELQRKIRRAERLCTAELRLTEGSQDLEVFLQLHRLSSPRKAMFMQAEMENFFRDLCSSLEAAQMLHLTTLWDGETPLASQFQLRFNNVLHLYNSGYDPEQAPLAPGMVLLGLNIRQACAAGVREYDLLRGTERYKYDVGGIDRPVYRLNWTTA